jgi:hypothetical protein
MARSEVEFLNDEKLVAAEVSLVAYVFSTTVTVAVANNGLSVVLASCLA